MPFKVKEFREQQNMTQKELCERANVSRQTLSDLESGREVVTTTATLKKIAETLNCKVSDIFLE